MTSSGSTSLAPDVFVVGAGGIGCAVGYALRAGGLAVKFVDADERKVAWGNSHGVGLDDYPLLPARFVQFEDWHPAGGSLILLCTKCFDNAAVLSRSPSSVNILPIQNGFDPALLQRSSLEGIASFVSECLPGQTHTRITRPGDLHLGRCGQGNGTITSPALEPVLQALDFGGSASGLVEAIAHASKS